MQSQLLFYYYDSPGNSCFKLTAPFHYYTNEYYKLIFKGDILLPAEYVIVIVFTANFWFNRGTVLMYDKCMK